MDEPRQTPEPRLDPELQPIRELEPVAELQPDPGGDGAGTRQAASGHIAGDATGTRATGEPAADIGSTTPATRIDPLRPIAGARPKVIAASLMLAAVIGFGLIATHAPTWLGADLSAVQWLSVHHVPLLDTIALTIAWLFDPPMAAAWSMAAAIAIAVTTRDLARTATFLGVIVVAWGGSEIIKWIVQRPRPDASLLAHPLLTEHSYSYPSGHTCFVAALGIAVIFLARDVRWRSLLIWIAAIAVVIVAMSRVYLGVHHPTDVAASVVYSSAASVIALVVWLRYGLPWLRSRRVPVPPLEPGTAEPTEPRSRPNG